MKGAVANMYARRRSEHVVSKISVVADFQGLNCCNSLLSRTKIAA